jgi:hypothetical protein
MLEEHSNQTPSTTRIGLKYGIYTGVSLVGYSLLLYTLNLNNESSLSILSSVIGIAGLVFGVIEYKRADEGYVSFGQAFHIGMVVSVISGLFDAFFNLIYLSYNSTILEKLKGEMIKSYEKQKLSDEQIEQLMPFINWFCSPSGIFIMSVIVSFVGGALLSLLVAAIMQKKRPMFE